MIRSVHSYKYVWKVIQYLSSAQIHKENICIWSTIVTLIKWRKNIIFCKCVGKGPLSVFILEDLYWHYSYVMISWLIPVLVIRVLVYVWSWNKENIKKWVQDIRGIRYSIYFSRGECIRGLSDSLFNSPLCNPFCF